MDPPERIYYLDENTLMVITSKSKLKVMNTPFRVYCVRNIGPIKSKQWYYVESVQGNGNTIIFTINNETYPHQYFQLFTV